jgi:hypothetical protein
VHACIDAENVCVCVIAKDIYKKAREKREKAREKREKAREKE